jgi:hypothetical protein
VRGPTVRIGAALYKYNVHVCVMLCVVHFNRMMHAVYLLSNKDLDMIYSAMP